MAHGFGQLLDVARPLAEQVEDLHPHRARQGLADPGELGEDGVLEFTARMGHGGQSIV